MLEHRHRLAIKPNMFPWFECHPMAPTTQQWVLLDGTWQLKTCWWLTQAQLDEVPIIGIIGIIVRIISYKIIICVQLHSTQYDVRETPCRGKDPGHFFIETSQPASQPARGLGPGP